MLVHEVLEEVCGVAGETTAARNSAKAQTADCDVRVGGRFVEEAPGYRTLTAMARPGLGWVGHGWERVVGREGDVKEMGKSKKKWTILKEMVEGVKREWFRRMGGRGERWDVR